MACKDDDEDFSDLKKSLVVDNFMIQQAVCMTVPKMLLKLSGFESHFMFISDTPMANKLFEKGRQDVLDLELYEEVLFKKSYESLICEAILCVVRYKKGKITKPRLTTVAAIKCTPFFAMQSELDELTFVRLYQLPCKLFYCF